VAWRGVAGPGRRARRRQFSAEYARRNGHAYLIMELVDGTVGYQELTPQSNQAFA
jgi:hypothetical protein